VVRLSSAVQLSQALLDVAAHLGFDEAERKKEGLLEDLNREFVAVVVVTGGDAFAAEGSGPAGEIDPVGLQALSSGGELSLGEWDLNHSSSVLAQARAIFGRVMQRGRDGILSLPAYVMAQAKDMTGEAGLTPAMRQYRAAKEAHPDALLFFRMGDFYELFYEDAIVASRELQLTLTARDKAKSVPM